MVRFVHNYGKNIEIMVPAGTKMPQIEGITRNKWYSLVAEKAIVRTKKDEKDSKVDPKTFEDLVAGVVNDIGYLSWISVYYCKIRLASFDNDVQPGRAVEK